MHESRKAEYLKSEDPLHFDLSKPWSKENDDRMIVEEKKFNSKRIAFHTTTGRFVDEDRALDEETNRRLVEVYTQINSDIIKFD
jgi:nuclear transport factor 2 (NTF2) superfamily protein